MIGADFGDAPIFSRLGVIEASALIGLGNLTDTQVKDFNGGLQAIKGVALFPPMSHIRTFRDNSVPENSKQTFGKVNIPTYDAKKKTTNTEVKY